jgi:hypothetical protein
MKNFIRIGNAGGFWGDDLSALRRQLKGGPLDYISSDYLAEITMSILRKQQLKNPKLGYVTDFVEQIVDNAALIKEKKVKIISNAGGMNPLGCAREIIRRLKPQGIQFRIAVIEGDDIYPFLNDYYPSKATFEDMEDGKPFSMIKDRVQSANAYLGVKPIVKALEEDAEIIIAGRVTDTSISIAPMIYEFDWAYDDWDKMASGLIAGHMMECGAQSTGGNYTDWKKVKKWDNFGYPVTEIKADGTFVMTKHPDTGGLINPDTVKEQLLYEMGDPKNYISPDVIVDFTTIRIASDGENRVRVSDIKGRPATPFLKVSMAYADGYKARGSVIISAPEALEKARKFEEIFWQRLNMNFEKQNTEYIGYDSAQGHLSPRHEPNEIMLRFTVYDKDREKLSFFAENIAPVILSGPPGVAVTGGRPKPQSVMTYWPTLIPKSLVETQVKILDEKGEILLEEMIPSTTGYETETALTESPRQISESADNYEPPTFPQSRKVRLMDICMARSGDKGDMVNIGVVARNENIYHFIKDHLTAERIKYIFGNLCKGKVTRFELDNLHSLNFLLDHSLDGGGTKSLMIDAQGKTFASALLNQYIDVPENILKTIP